jgi:hypothetical protein
MGSSTRARVPTKRSTMSTLGFRTHVLLVLAGAAGVLASLSRPWYARPPLEPAGDGIGTGPLYGLSDALGRWVTDPAGTTGWNALGHWATALAVLSGLVAACALLSLAGAQGIAREPLRYGSFAVVVIAVWHVVDSPGPNDALELRLGALVGVASAIMLWVCGQGVANAPTRRHVEPARYTPPAPPGHVY